jgi:MFS family permease
MRHFGRKKLAIASFSLNALASLVMIIDIPILRVIFALIAKFANSGEWCFMGYIFMETYPTEMRHTIYGLTKVFARFGAIIAPFIKEIVRGNLDFNLKISCSN